MSENYFSKLKSSTQTRLWVNNPTIEEIKLALDHGAVSCTSNPAYAANLLKRVPEYVKKFISESLDISDNNSIVAAHVQRKLVAQVMEYFRPVFDASNGADGFVSLQGDPYAEVSTERIIAEARAGKELGPNCIAKIPVVANGMEAIDTLVRENMPTIATEIFSISQMIAACEVYGKASAESGNKPPFYVTHITGIFDEYLKKEFIDPVHIDIDDSVLYHAGLAVVRKQYKIFKERGYDGIMLGGGARGLQHFTECVGGEMHITINWKTAEEILALDPPVEDTLFRDVPKEITNELCERIPDFKKAWDEDGLTIEEFENYRPVQRFRRAFIVGWDQLISAIAGLR